ncbi:hypothetical protein EH165_14795 [Nakamurella antarctica]|uniref:Uncharacterized protein n=1 Tax=Nakamurella antarctica TaxID=1902245 RepID=A0A3G8ZPZ1_9ACTN|nr:hypothetical protein [Nakamurella antarctica]AZI59218.1 hypothetical protein EH165_14795 [Nakamurella antarctica]
MTRKYKVDEVFGVGVGNSTPAYVDRGNLDSVFKRGLEASRHVSVHGGSKQGKTWLRKRGLKPEESVVVQCTTTSTSVSILEEALAQLGVTAKLGRTQTGSLTGEVGLSSAVKARFSVPFLGQASGEAGATAKATKASESETQEQFFAQTAANLHWVAEAVTRSQKRFVIEDFHYLPEEEQRIFASWMKALGEYGCHLVIIGVWAQSHLLSYFNGDLEGRVDDIHLEWSNEDLHAVLTQGAEALAISFSETLSNALISDAYGNVGLLHRLAHEICILEKVDDAQAGFEIGRNASLTDARRDVAAQMSGRFETFAANFVRGMRRMPEGLVVYLHLLRAFTASDDADLLAKGVDSRDLLKAIQDEGISLRGSDLTQALERVDQLQVKIQISPPVLTYHRAGKRVQLVDRAFLFFRKYGEHTWPWDEPDEIDNDLAGSAPLDLFS